MFARESSNINPSSSALSALDGYIEFLFAIWGKKISCVSSSTGYNSILNASKYVWAELCTERSSRFQFRMDRMPDFQERPYSRPCDLSAGISLNEPNVHINLEEVGIFARLLSPFIHDFRSILLSPMRRIRPVCIYRTSGMPHYPPSLF